jgi:lysyl-tRNA synthetase class 1
VLQVPVEVVDAEAGIVRFEDHDRTWSSTASSAGKAKLQWKVDWAMRWVALGVDYEMCGKDLTDSVRESGKIARVLGGRPPEGLIYELFLDENGEKISKSKGNGLTIEQWLTYGSEESLGFYLFREPKERQALHIGSSRARWTNTGSFARSWPSSRSSSSLAIRSGTCCAPMAISGGARATPCR